MKYEVYERIDSLGKQVMLLSLGFAIGSWYMNQRIDDLEEKVNEILTQQIRSSEQRTIGHATGGSLPGSAEDSERSIAKLSSLEYGK